MQIQLPPPEPLQQYHDPSPYSLTATGNSNSNSNSNSSGNNNSNGVSVSSSQHIYPSRHTISGPDDVDEMDPYQQYPGHYGQQQPALPHPQHPHRPYMQNHQNQLPPLAGSMNPPMGMPTHPGYMGAQQVPPMTQQPQPSLVASSTRPSAGNPPAQDRPMSSSTVKDGHKYTLHVVQQPQRARMCGFGDKDRRPITPPPCVRLSITDADTGREIEMSEIPSDPSFFVLQVDLWADNADREANVVRASTNSPAVSISSATTTSYPPPADHPRVNNEGAPLMYLGQDGQAMYSHMPTAYAISMSRPMGPGGYGGNMYYSQLPSQAIQQQQVMPPAQSSSAMYTRNLIGSLTVNASQLKDNEGKMGYWFVLQDLSVRTEGFFRLRMSFIDISNHGAPGVNRGKAPVLSWIFSDIFQVYSAKKFPGVIESTPLSKTFASQGIKIPIRKDNKGEQLEEDDGGE